VSAVSEVGLPSSGVVGVDCSVVIWSVVELPTDGSLRGLCATFVCLDSDV
jgi:hypothetical protein